MTSLVTFLPHLPIVLVVKIHQLDTIVCVAYRPPDTRVSEFTGLLKCLDETLSSLPSPTPNIVLMGDFNLPHSSIIWKRSEEGLVVPLVASHREEETAGGKQDRLQAQQLIDLANKYFLIQEILEPTHATEVLDLVFTNNCELVCGTHLENWTAFTDHRLVVVDTTFKVATETTTLEEQFLCDTGKRYAALNFNKAVWKDIIDELENTAWDTMEQLSKNDPVAALGHFHDTVLEILERLVPARLKRPQKKARMHRMRRLLWKKLGKVRKAIKTASSIHKLSVLLQRQWELEAQLSLDYTAVSNKEEDEAVLRIKQNSKAFFSFARSRQKTKARVGPFLDDSGKPNPSPDFSAEALRQQYNSVFATPRPAWTVTNFPDHFKADNSDDNTTLQDICFGPDDIEKACAELKGTAAAGPDGVPALLLKTCRKQLSKPIDYLWRSYLNSGCIPPELLIVLICPIHKGGAGLVPKTIGHLIKVFERVLRRVLVSHIDKLGLLPDGQHGSRSGRSTRTQLVSHWDNIMEGLEQGDGVDCVYLDFAKAFDKVETGVLLHKLRDGKVRGKVGCWLAAFLDSTTRQQSVAVEGRVSALSPVISGVPQGTVLGPVLFLLHIADIARGVSSETKTSSYVDDTRANRCIRDADMDCQALQSDLASIYEWADDVSMVFNSDKFECLRFWPGKASTPEFQYLSPDNTPIEEKQHLRDLGVEISSDLSFTIHIENTVTAANRLVGWTMRTFRRRSKVVMMTIWKTLIQSKLDYCSQLWSPADQAAISKLESVSRNFTAQIAGLEEADYWERLKLLRMYSQERRRERYRIIFIWKVLQGLVQGYPISSRQNPRQGRLVVVAKHHSSAPAVVKNAREASLSVQGSRLFNLLPKHIRDIDTGTTDQFKMELDSWLESIPDQPTIQGRQRAGKTNSLIDQVAYCSL